MKKNITVVLLLVLAAGCSSTPRDGASAPPMDPTRKVSEQDCSRPLNNDGGNLMCREVTEAERRARAAEEERQAKARKEAEERAARERLERERAEKLALEEAARRGGALAKRGLPRRSGSPPSAAGWRPRPRSRPSKSASVRRRRRQKPLPASAPRRKPGRQPSVSVGVSSRNGPPAARYSRTSSPPTARSTNSRG